VQFARDAMLGGSSTSDGGDERRCEWDDVSATWDDYNDQTDEQCM